MDSISDRIAQLCREAAWESQGRFTLLPQFALRRLAELAQAEPQTYLLELVRWLVSQGEEWLEIEVTDQQLCVSRLNNWLLEEDVQPLPQALFSQQRGTDQFLARAIFCALATQAQRVELKLGSSCWTWHEFGFEAGQQPQRNQVRGDEPGYWKLLRRPGSNPRNRGRETTLLQSLSATLPLRLRLNGRLLSQRIAHDDQTSWKSRARALQLRSPEGTRELGLPGLSLPQPWPTLGSLREPGQGAVEVVVAGVPLTQDNWEQDCPGLVATVWLDEARLDVQNRRMVRNEQFEQLRQHLIALYEALLRLALEPPLKSWHLGQLTSLLQKQQLGYLPYTQQEILKQWEDLPLFPTLLKADQWHPHRPLGEPRSLAQLRQTPTLVVDWKDRPSLGRGPHALHLAQESGQSLAPPLVAADIPFLDVEETPYGEGGLIPGSDWARAVEASFEMMRGRDQTCEIPVGRGDPLTLCLRRRAISGPDREGKYRTLRAGMIEENLLDLCLDHARPGSIQHAHFYCWLLRGEEQTLVFRGLCSQPEKLLALARALGIPLTTSLKLPIPTRQEALRWLW